MYGAVTGREMRCGRPGRELKMGKGRFKRWFFRYQEGKSAHNKGSSEGSGKRNAKRGIGNGEEKWHQLLQQGVRSNQKQTFATYSDIKLENFNKEFLNAGKFTGKGQNAERGGKKLRIGRSENRQKGTEKWSDGGTWGKIRKRKGLSTSGEHNGLK